jgi:hypothetical protein
MCECPSRSLLVRQLEIVKAAEEDRRRATEAIESEARIRRLVDREARKAVGQRRSHGAHVAAWWNILREIERQPMKVTMRVYLVVREREMTSREIADRTGLNITTVAGLLESLVKQKAVVKRALPSDGRPGRRNAYHVPEKYKLY